jgi:hypothetical protein
MAPMVMDAVELPDPGTAPPQIVRAEKRKRRVSDDIIHAFHFACDTKDLEIAEQLLAVLEKSLVSQADQPDSARKRNLAPLVAAYERLWSLRQPHGV